MLFQMMNNDGLLAVVHASQLDAYIAKSWMFFVGGAL